MNGQKSGFFPQKSVALKPVFLYNKGNTGVFWCKKVNFSNGKTRIW